MLNRETNFNEARRVIINELVEKHGEESIRTKVKEYGFIGYVNDLAWAQIRTASHRDLSSARLSKGKTRKVKA